MGRPPRITRDQILEAARVGFTSRGFAATTLADIARSVSVTPAAILRHFESKQALFHAAMSTRRIDVPEFVAALADLDPASDPAVVLRNFARRMVPFLSEVIRPAIAVQMHATTLVVPFNTQEEEIPPRRAIRILTTYFARAVQAGTVRAADPRALALLFLGQLQSYVFIHQILELTPVYPLEDYIDAQIDLWSLGVLRGGFLAQEDHSSPAPRRRRGGPVPLPSPAAPAKAAGAGRNAGSKVGKRRVAGGRTSRPRPRR